MRVQIRSSVFETNSSSVHSITMCNKDTWNKWISGELMYRPIDKHFLHVDEAEQYNYEISQEYNCWDNYSDDGYCKNWEYYYLTFNKFQTYASMSYDIFDDSFNDTVAFGYYGYDN